LSLAENDDVDALKVRSVKNCKSLLECPTITGLVAAFDAKAFNDTELLKSYLAGGNRIIFAGKPTGNVMVKYLTQHTAYGFISCTSDFWYLCSKKTNTLHICVAA